MRGRGLGKEQQQEQEDDFPRQSLESAVFYDQMIETSASYIPSTYPLKRASFKSSRLLRWFQGKLDLCKKDLHFFWYFRYQDESFEQYLRVFENIIWTIFIKENRWNDLINAIYLPNHLLSSKFWVYFKQ